MSGLTTYCRAAGEPGEPTAYRDLPILAACEQHARGIRLDHGERIRIAWHREDGAGGTHTVECRHEYQVVDLRGGE